MSETATTIIVILLPTLLLGLWLAYRGIRRARNLKTTSGIPSGSGRTSGQPGQTPADISLTMAALDDTAPRKSAGSATPGHDFDTSETKTHSLDSFGSGGGSIPSDGGSGFSGGSDF